MKDLSQRPSGPASPHHLLSVRIFVQPSAIACAHTPCGAGAGGDEDASVDGGDVGDGGGVGGGANTVPGDGGGDGGPGVGGGANTVPGDGGGDGGPTGQSFQLPTVPQLPLGLVPQTLSRFGLDAWRMKDLSQRPSGPASPHHLLSVRIFVQPFAIACAHTPCGAGAGGGEAASVDGGGVGDGGDVGDRGGVGRGENTAPGDGGGDGGSTGQSFQSPTVPQLPLGLVPQTLSRFGLDAWRMKDISQRPSGPASPHHLLSVRIFVQPFAIACAHTPCGAGAGGGEVASVVGGGGGGGGVGEGS